MKLLTRLLRLYLVTPSILYSLLLISATSCHSSSGTATSATSTTDTIARVEAAPFEADSAYKYVREQVDFGPRAPGQPGHEACAAWIVSRLESWGYTVHIQEFDGMDYYGKKIRGKNIIATRSPLSKERILLMAHWDTRVVADHDPTPSQQHTPILGADDGASGAAVLLELARQESLQPRETVATDYVFFDLEDGGKSEDEKSWCQGSTSWAKHAQRKGYTARYGILLDMVGARGARFYYELYSKTYAAPILNTLWATGATLGWGEYFVQAEGSGMTDDHVPVIKHLGIPCVDIINYDPTRSIGFGAHWHTLADNLEVISLTTLKAVGQTVATFLGKGL